MNHKQKAIELLPEKYQDYDFNGMSFVESLTDYEQGSNQMHSKAVEVVVGLLKRIKESEEQRLNDKESIASLTKSCKEAITELQSAKERIGVLEEEMELKIGVWLCPKCKRGCPSGKICRDCLEQELQSLKTKYQELKGKLFQTILESGLNTEARGYMVELGLDVNKREALNRKSVKRLANAILKYLEATNDK